MAEATLPPLTTAAEAAAPAETELTFEQLVEKLQKEEFATEEAPAEPEVEIPAAEEIPEIEIPAAEPIEEAVQAPAAEVIAEAPVEIPAEAEKAADDVEQVLKDLEGLSDEEFEIELPTEMVEEEAPIEEISFEGLEELFKD